MELIIWENIAYLASDKRRAEAFATLNKRLSRNQPRRLCAQTLSPANPTAPRNRAAGSTRESKVQLRRLRPELLVLRPHAIRFACMVALSASWFVPMTKSYNLECSPESSGR